MARSDVTARVALRTRTGQFKAKLTAREGRAVRSTAERLAGMVRAAAPIGPARDDYSRRPRIRDSVSVIVQGTQASVRVRTGHAASQEHGARPHAIPGAFGRDTTVMHPGNAPRPYVAPAAKAAPRMLMEAIKQR